MPTVVSRSRATQRHTRCPFADDGCQVADGLVGHHFGSPPVISARQWRAAPAARRVSPGPQSPYAPWRGQTANARSPGGTVPPRGHACRSVVDQPMRSVPGEHPGHVVYATPRSGRSTDPRAEAERLCPSVTALVFRQDPELVLGRVGLPRQHIRGPPAPRGRSPAQDAGRAGRLSSPCRS